MADGRQTLQGFILEEQHRLGAGGALEPLFGDLVRAIVGISIAVARRALAGPSDDSPSIEALAGRSIAIATCARDGQLAAVAVNGLPVPYPVPAPDGVGGYLLVLDPLEGARNLEVAGAAGTIFSLLRRPRADGPVGSAEFLQRGDEQLGAGYAVYGPATQVVLTLGRGVFGFTLDSERGDFILTHPNLRIPELGRELAVDAAGESSWEPPLKRYVSECLAGGAGPRAIDFGWRWLSSLVPDVHRLLLRGGLVLAPRSAQLLYQASPLALLVEQAGGAASTGRARVLEVVPAALDQRVPLVLGSRAEVERVVRYHGEHDAGLEPFYDPLFNTRSLFRVS